MSGSISIRGAKEHNLKNVNLEIPKNNFVVFTGISGSGKSSMAFDTIYAEGQRKYVESLSTYSDIYTGVLIAAPLFFVTALSLVSVLGGTIGGLSVNTIITLGTYLVIPGLNLLFLIFLEMNQPEI